MKLLRFTAHAERVMVQRDLDRSWIEAAIREPDWRDRDPRDVSVSRFFKQIPEREGRVLRVPCVETESEIRILSAYLDRGARQSR